MQKNTYIAKTLAGLEPVLADELRELGATDISALRRAVAFSGDKPLLYNANIWLRTAISVLQPVRAFSFEKKEDFYDQVKEEAWNEWFAPDKTIAVIATAHDSEVFTNTMFLAQLAKDAIVDRFYEAYGRRPDVDTAGANIRIVVNVQGNQCKVSLDSSGDALFKRGYRRAGGMAPLNEVLAAGLIKLAGWDMASPFLDPMCGSGTFSIEAAMMSASIAPGADRRQFGFSHWNDFDPELFQSLRETAKEKQVPLKTTVIASDIKGQMLDITRQNAMNAGLLGSIQVRKQDFFSYHVREKNGWVMLNPPYGHRMTARDTRALYIHIGDTLKTRFAGFTAGVISADLGAMKHLGLKPKRKYQVFNGPLKAAYNIYDLFGGSHKEYKRGSAS